MEVVSLAFSRQSDVNSQGRLIDMMSDDKALVLIPCCKGKDVDQINGEGDPPLAGLKPLRNQLLSCVRQTPLLAKKPENQMGIFDKNAPMTQAVKLYTGNFYQVAREPLFKVFSREFPSVRVLIVSSFYGLVRLREFIKEYELQMGDTLHNGTKVYRFWQQRQLSRMLRDYVIQNGITYVWSLLPDSMPHFPYHRVFKQFWKEARNTEIRCFHLKIPGAGSGTGYKRAEWLVEVQGNNFNQLVGKPFPSDRFEYLPGYTFCYESC